MPPTDGDLRAQAREYYEARLRQHGPTPRGVDWNSAESQTLRFAQLAKLWQGEPVASIVDYGCGYGALAQWLGAAGHRGRYTGFDLSDEMVRSAHDRDHGHLRCTFTSDRTQLERSDYVVASGVFNVKGDVGVERWQEYVLGTIDDLMSLATRGAAFNALTRYSDADRQREDLYYADPLALFDHCIQRYSRRAALLHDYPLYEFTLMVRL
jgi:predicted TPR repeat methyltransferase